MALVSGARFGRDVPIEVFPDHLASDREAVARLGGDARVAATSSNPDIPAPQEVGEDGGVRLVMSGSRKAAREVEP